MQNLDQKVNQQTHTSPENFTPTLLVMFETFRRSDSNVVEIYKISGFVPKEHFNMKKKIPHTGDTNSLDRCG